jgi:hypothetical protein
MRDRMIGLSSYRLRLSLSLLLVAVGGCVPHGKNVSSGPNTAFASQSARMCLSALKSNKVSFAALPDRNFGGGCSAANSVSLLDIGTPVTNLGPMTCTLANGFTDWTRDIVRPAAKKILGSPLARIETSGTYSCRRVGGTGNLSQHAHANAVDVFAFVMQDGRKVSVLGGWNGTAAEQNFLRHLHKEACGRFGTVLGPSYNREHANHFHLDMAPSRLNGSPFCR